ncbi:uncharacterized protein [Montipora foliosa]|uniref:uncharacterized protein isoform X2 n=1 Tax=Montipora foliosa TaxID=591990 RepID=UPI0035F1ECE3
MRIVLFMLIILMTAQLDHSLSSFLKRKRREVSVTFMDMLLRSEGCEDPGVAQNTCGRAKIFVHGQDHSLGRRGHNIVVVDASTGNFIDKKHFDTHSVASSGNEMRDFLKSINGEKIVLIATQDTAEKYWLPAKPALIKLGGTEPILMEFRGSFAFIGYAGNKKPSWIAQEQRPRGKGPSVIHLRIPLQQSPPEPRMNIFVRSEGCEDPGRTGCGTAFIKVNQQGYSLHSRGMNVVIFSAEGVFLETRAFDNHGIPTAGTSAANYLNSLSGEKIVLAATQDEAYHNSGPVLGALPRIGMKLPITFGYRGSLALIGYAGSYKPSWITQAHALRGLGPSTVTASIAPVNVLDIHIRSEGCNDPGKTTGTCGIAYIYVNGVDKSPHTRGHNVVILDARTGAVVGARAFDTLVDSSSGNNLANYLDSFVGDYIVLVAIQDEGSKYIGPAVPALKRKGAVDPIVTDFRGSFALAGYAQVNKPSWVTQERKMSGKGPSEIRIKVPLILAPYETIGCYKDTGDRAIHTLEGKDPILDGGYKARTNAIEKCYEAAKKRGYKVFAVQDGGWCASSATAENTYDKYGPYHTCASDGEGGAWGNQVYFIREYLTSYGCFKDTGNRAIPPIEGPPLDDNYQARKHAISKCAVATLRKGFQVFAVQDGGWCASSNTAENTFDKYGKSIACKDDGEGGALANNVYLIECQQVLGMECGAIKDEQIKASSEWDANHAAIQGRLNFQKSGIKQGAWSAKNNDKNQWLQIDLRTWYTKVTAVASQGRNQVDQWVTKYKLQYSNDGYIFQYYKEQGQTVDEEFTANWDQDTIIYHKLNPPITARYIRFRPVNWHNHISMRVEVYGCKQACQSALGVQSGAITDNQMSASSEWDLNHADSQGRLFFESTTKADSWSAKRNDANQWLQIDLGVYSRVTRVASQGRHDHPQWVTKYKLQYSNDGNTFFYYVEAGQTAHKEFPGNKDQHTVVFHELRPTVTARFIRFRPVKWHGHISMRVEIYGCNQGSDGNSCSPNPCKNGATCVDLANGYSCDCKPGYTGNDCQTNINECSPNPCQNGATCVDLVGGHRCDCTQGYTGSSCETNINECSPNPCQNGATCVDLVGGHRCHCAQGYTGSSCETNINECSPTPCQNGATCVDLVGGHRCHCAQGYTGSSCETNINECSPNPCQNGATCVDLVGGHRCHCAQGYTGSSCETNINECSPNPCQNGATCVDLVGGHRCHCAQGYTGSSCETNINECSPNPCQNGATCVDLVGGHRCHCAQGYTGSSCETNINDCAVNHCKNGATCVDLVGSYQCICAPGFIGVICEEVEEDECEE